MFRDSTLSENISMWDVSSVPSMDYMFKKVRNFNANISWWDVSSVTSMYAMFHDTNSFNGDISGWDVSSVTNMGAMFYTANPFNHELCWDVGSKNTNEMFERGVGGKIGCPPSYPH